MDSIHLSLRTSSLALVVLIPSVLCAGQLVTIDNPSTNPVNTSASVTVNASTSPSPTGFLVGTTTTTVSNANPLPISGSITANSVNISTYIYGTTGSTATAIAGQNPAGNYATFSVDFSSRSNMNSYSQNTSTITFNGVGQPVTQSGNWLVVQSTIGAINPAGQSLSVAIASGSISNTGFNVNNAPTVVQSTSAVNGSTISVTNAVGTQLTVVSTGIPVTSLSPLTVTGSTIGVVNGGSTFNATINTALPAGTNNIGTINGSTVGVTNAGGGSLTIVPFSSGTYTVTPGTGAWNITGSTVNVISTGTLTVRGALSNNGASATANRVGALVGIAQNAYGNNGATMTQGNDASAMILSTSGLVGVWSGPDITFNSYTGSTNTFTITIATQDISALCGNANKTVYLYGVRASCTQTTAGNFNLSVVKRSAGYTGTWSTMTTSPQDSNYTTAQSTAIFITGNNVTNGALVGHLDNYQLGCMAAATATPNDIYISPSSWRMKPIVLRGTSQCVGLNIENASISGGKFTATWEWMEVTSP